jgi:hypothetical protein
MGDNVISVIDAARQLGLRKQTTFKILKRLGIATVKQQATERGQKGQLIAYIRGEDFAALKLEVESRTPDQVVNGETDNVLELGMLYLIQLEPDHDAGRFKLGFTASMAERLRHLRCSAPFAVVVKTWPCKQLWERTAIDCATWDCERLHTEVFRTSDLGTVAAKCDAFFAVMPSVTNE